MTRTSKINKGFFTSGNDEWATPLKLFSILDSEFVFTLDVCALPSNRKCENFLSPEEDSLASSSEWNGRCYMNPPYSNIQEWVKKATEESMKKDTIVVGLLPARTDTKWFHNYVVRNEIRFVTPRVVFEGAMSNAPFASIIVIWRGFLTNNYSIMRWR